MRRTGGAAGSEEDLEVMEGRYLGNQTSCDNCLISKRAVRDPYTYMSRSLLPLEVC